MFRKIIEVRLRGVRELSVGGEVEWRVMGGVKIFGLRVNNGEGIVEIVL